MNPPSRSEIETLANEIFGADIERRIRDFAREETRVLAQVRSRRNIGGYLPALVQCGAERLRSEILTLADAWVEAFTQLGVVSEVWADTALETAASQMAGGAVSRIRGQLDLISKRTRNPISAGGGHIERELATSKNGALRVGKLRLKQQRLLPPVDSSSNRVALDPEVFRGLNREFADLAKQEVPSPHREQLLVWISYVAGKNAFGRFTLGYGPSGGFRAHFEEVATRAGVKLGAPRGVPPINFWLHHLFLDLLQSDPDKYLFAGKMDAGGTIQSVCAASARFCLRLAKRATEQQHRSGVEASKPTDKSLAGPPSAKSATRALNESRPRKRDPGTQKIRDRVRKLRNDGLSDRDICRQLNDSPRPPRAVWRDLTWPTAYTRHTSAVAKWLSEACR